MAKQTINVGITANDKKGDSLRAAFQKVNANFTELFNSSGITGTTDRLVNGDYSLELSEFGIVTFPSGPQGESIAIAGDEVAGINCPITLLSVSSSVNLVANQGADERVTWTFDPDGDLTLPESGNIRQRHSFIRTTTASAPAATATVVWSANQDWTSSIKLTIQVEGNVTGDSSGWHVQTCESTIASRGYANGTNGYGDPEMTVYGVVHTSAFPLATFEVQRNATTRLVEVVATGADINNNIIVSIHSVEIGTTD